jgi:high affinity Mn2+ porin
MRGVFPYRSEKARADREPKPGRPSFLRSDLDVRSERHARPARLAPILGALIGARLLVASSPASAQAAPPASHQDEAFDIMNVLAHHGLHDINDETWNAYGQFTYISSWKLPFHAPYTNKNGSIGSLVPEAERGFTASATLFVGLRLWPGGEAYVVPEVIAERALSGLHGLGGSIQNFELQKTGGETPQLYRSRTFLRQNIGFGGKRVVKTSDPMQLGSVVDGRRLVITAGNFTVLDVFDRNSITWDPRQTFFNMAFMTHSSWDFPSDARGYSWGASFELYWDDWALRAARVTPPENPNSLPVDFRLDKHYGDEFELEHDHKVAGLSGAVRFLAYRNRVVTGRFDEAIAAFKNDATKNAAGCTTYNYSSTNATAPDLCWVRRPNVKVGVGINLEQHVVNEDMGVFLRAMYSDGRSEVDAFNPADRSLSFGAVAKGSAWNRPFDVAGVGYGLAWISEAHADYLAMGGVDGFVGDGALRQAPETVFEAFYSVNLVKALWLSGDYQHITSPGFNADRGPVNIFGARAHAEF